MTIQPRHQNSFTHALLGLTVPPGVVADIFSRACVHAFETAAPDDYGYAFTQIFEPDVLREVALLNGVGPGQAARLEHQPTAAMRGLAQRVGQRADLSITELAGLASTLVCVSRFELATTVLDLAAERAVAPRGRFEVAWLRFLVSNRCDDGTQSAAAFEAMRVEAQTGDVAPARVMDMCTQAVVWYLKRREVSAELLRWSVATGSAMARGRRLDTSTMSSWYRGVAMLPAATGDRAKTRRLMERARETAEDAVQDADDPVAKNALKTYYESTIKENIYVNRDVDAALAAGKALIELDPVWSPSYGEVAQVHQRFGDLEQAAHYYEKAAELGPPYLGNHLLQAARCRHAAQQQELALGHCASLLGIVPGSGAATALADEILAGAGPSARAEFAEQTGRG